MTETHALIPPEVAAELARLREEREEAIDEMVQERKRRRAAEAELAKLREKVERLEGHIRSESSRLAQIDASRNKAEAENARLREDFLTVASARDYLRDEVARLREEVAEWEAAAGEDDALRENVKLRESVDHLQGEVAEMRQREEMWRARAIFARSEADRLVLERRAESGTF